MKAKKIIALVAATTLAMSSMTAFAETLQGDVNYVDTKVYKVQLPTTAGMSFALDPQGLSSLESGNYSAAGSGEIVSTGKMIAKNMSSVAIDLYADFYITDTHETPVDLKTAITKTQDTDKEEKKEVAMAIVPKLVNGEDAIGTVKLGNAEINGSSKIDVTTNAAKAAITGANKLAMGAAKYEFTGTRATGGYKYEMVEKTETGVELTITGKVAKDYDWKDYVGADAKKITLNAVFAIYDVGDTSTALENVGSGDSGDSSSSVATYSKASGGTITLTAGKNAIKSVAYGPANDNMPNAMTGYSYAKPTLTLPSGLFSNVSAGTSRYVKVTYGDNSTEVVEIKVQD